MVAPGIVQKLNKREFQILSLMAEGRSNLYISRKLFVNLESLGPSLSKIYTKLEVSGDKHKALHPRVASVLIYYKSPKAIMDAFPDLFQIEQQDLPND